ncbi:MAG TPA: DUF2867 domain-containing protein [Rhizomicrobium sp.]|jgi:hypothetical protein
MNAAAIATPPDCGAVLPGFTFADSYAIEAPAGTDASAALRIFAGAAPGWMKALLNLRNTLGKLVGLKPAEGSGFPVISQSPERVCVGFDDWHLDFRVVTTAEPQHPKVSRVTLTTIVRTHNIAGRTYLALIMPFHRLIARETLNRLNAPVTAPARR